MLEPGMVSNHRLIENQIMAGKNFTTLIFNCGSFAAKIREAKE
jgi:hypothetical protein